jgi:hypothetical protein
MVVVVTVVVVVDEDMSWADAANGTAAKALAAAPHIRYFDSGCFLMIQLPPIVLFRFF